MSRSCCAQDSEGVWIIHLSRYMKDDTPRLVRHADTTLVSFVKTLGMMLRPNLELKNMGVDLNHQELAELRMDGHVPVHTLHVEGDQPCIWRQDQPKMLNREYPEEKSLDTLIQLAHVSE